MAKRGRPTNEERAASLAASAPGEIRVSFDSSSDTIEARELPWSVERAAQDFGYDPSQVLSHAMLKDGRAVLVMKSGHKLVWPDHIAKSKEIPEHQKRGERIQAKPGTVWDHINGKKVG
jgi:hypothetical protein